MKLFGKIAVGTICSMMAIGVGVGLTTANTKAANAEGSYGYTLTNGTSCTSVVVNGINGIKMGTAKANGNCTLTVPAGTTSITLGAAAWTGVTGSTMSITGSASITPSSVTLTPDTGISGSGTAYTLAGNEEDYHFTFELSGVTSETTFTIAPSKRAAVWYVESPTVDEVSVELEKIYPTYGNGWAIETDGSGTMRFTSTSTSIYADGYYAVYTSNDSSLEFENGGRVNFSEFDPRMCINYTCDGGGQDDDVDVTVTVYASDNSVVATDTKTFTFTNPGSLTPTIHPTGVLLDCTEINAIVDDVPVALVATVVPANAANQEISWTTSNPDVAAVSSDGVVSFVHPGSATITATTVDGGFTATCAVTVAPKTYVEPEPIAKTVAELVALAAGTNATQTKAYTVTGTAKNIVNSVYGNFDLVDGDSTIAVYGSSRTATALTFNTETGLYVFSNPKDFVASDIPAGSIVTMKVITYVYSGKPQACGVITNITAGSSGEEEPATLNKTVAELTALCAGGSTGQTQAYTVTGTVADVQTSAFGNFNLVDETGSIIVYGSSQTATALVWDGFNYVFTNPKDFDANVVSNGKVVTMKVIAYKFNTTCEISGVITSVSDGAQVDVTGVSLNKTSTTITTGHTETLTATIAPSNASNKNVTWSSDNAGVASVVNGVVTGVSAGTANITVTTVDGGFTATCAVTVETSTSTFTGLITEGKYYIKHADKYLKSNGASNAPAAVTTKGEATEFNFVLVADNEYEIKTTDGSYLYSTSSNNGVRVGNTEDTWVVSTGTLASGAYDFKETKNNRFLTLYNDSDFRAYTSATASNRKQNTDVEAVGGVAGATLESITVTGATTTFTAGDDFAFGGTVTATYSDSSTLVVTDSVIFSGYDMFVAGTQTVTVSYTENGVTKTATYQIVISASTSEFTGMIAEGNYYIKHASKYLKSNGTDAAPSAVDSTADATVFTFTLVADNVYTIKTLDGDYLYATATNNGVRVGPTSDRWEVAAGTRDSGAYDFKDLNSNRFLSLYNNADFRGYTTADASNRKENTDVEAAGGITPSAEAKAWAQGFVSGLTCDATGATAPNATVWAEQATAFAALSTSAKAIITGADASSDSLDSDIKAAVMKYDYIVNKYGVASYTDFLGRAGSSSANINNKANDTTMYFVIGAAAILTVSTFAAYLLLKKKKEN